MSQSNFAGALKSNGEPWMWGRNLSGQLGDNSVTDKSSPVSVVGAHALVQLSLGLDVGYGLKPNGSIWAWGEGSAGQLGDNSLTNKSSPVRTGTGIAWGLRQELRGAF